MPSASGAASARVDHPVLLDSESAVEGVARDRHLEVVAAAGAVERRRPARPGRPASSSARIVSAAIGDDANDGRAAAPSSLSLPERARALAFALARRQRARDGRARAAAPRPAGRGSTRRRRRTCCASRSSWSAASRRSPGRADEYEPDADEPRRAQGRRQRRRARLDRGLRLLAALAARGRLGRHARLARLSRRLRRRARRAPACWPRNRGRGRSTSSSVRSRASRERLRD